VRFDGSRPWDIRVHDPAFYDRILRQGSLGFGEAYMDNAWESECLDETLHKLLSARINVKIKGLNKLRFLGAFLHSILFNYQSRKRAFQVGEHHYGPAHPSFRLRGLSSGYPQTLCLPV